MSEVLVEREEKTAARVAPGGGRRVGIVGVPCGVGASIPGVDLGPAAMRVAGLRRRIEGLGYRVEDRGDVKFDCPAEPPAQVGRVKFLREITEGCARLAAEVRDVLEGGALPVVLGGDHSIAIGTGAGVASFYRERGQQVGLIWFDAHADMNTPETTPSGNIHGMPLAVLLGRGAPELTGVEGFSPKLDPRFCAHIGARDVDAGERELIRELGIRFFTMREIDERGMSACVDEAVRIASGAAGGYYVTLDVDALDPGDAPGSGTVVRGGLTYREAHLAMEKIAEAGGAVAVEVVEINTALDVNNRTAVLGVELILSALGKTIL
jgi:arginase